MNKTADKIKSIISEAKALDRFLMSRGIDPRFVTTDQKVSHAKSGEFIKWLRDRKVEEVESEDELIEQKTPQEKFKSGLKKAGYDPDKGAKRLSDVLAKQKKEREEHEKKYGHLYAKEEVTSSTERLKVDYTKVRGQVGNPYKKDNKLVTAPIKKEEVTETDYSKIKGQTSNKYNKDVKLNGTVTLIGKEPKGEYERKVDKYLKKKYNKEEVESIDEISKELKTSYRQKAIGDIRALRPHAEKGEYTDLAKNVMKKRQAGVNRSMKEEEEIEENHIAVAMGKELDDEGSMTLNQMDQMERAVDMVRKYIGKDMTKQLPSWVQSKITLATDYIDSVGNYLNTTNEEVKEPTGQLKDACWTGYTAVGMKNKNGKKVPNCVPTKESFEDEHGVSDKKKQSSKSARIIKSIYKRKNMKEDTYDHEKDDKSIATYGKKPKMAKTDDKAGMGENKPSAAAIMSGGTTLTGQKRDTVEIDPLMRVRPGQTDTTKKVEKK